MFCDYEKDYHEGNRIKRLEVTDLTGKKVIVDTIFGYRFLE